MATTDTEEAKATARGLVEDVVNAHDPDAVEEYLTEDVTIRGAAELDSAGEFAGIPTTGNEVDYTASFFGDVVDGRMAHLDYDADRVAMMEDLGIID